jgi:alkanesulfonate monooxygenase SsuD/methylene tetrahydromethanopterin reductase-like flavin-dependent oxidoreductase (luciferase family)
MPDRPSTLHLAVALDGAGWHPAAWREPDARPGELFTAQYWIDLVQQAERGQLDFVTIEDSLNLQSDDRFDRDRRTDRVRGRLDAVLIAARVAPVTTHIGIVPTAITTHTEPFHVSKAIATLDFVSHGRAGVRVQLSARRDAAQHFGRREIPQLTREGLDDPTVRRFIEDQFDEAADYVEVLRRLWDSWEDDAEIRDVTTGRFIDRDKLHYVDFEGRWFSVKGPSITPRPPQGHPLVTALGHGSTAYRLIARSTDVGFVAPKSSTHVEQIVKEIRGAQQSVGRTDETLHVFGDLVVFLDAVHGAALARQHRLDDLAGSPFVSDALVFTGTPGALADLLVDWHAAGLSGFRLRPATIPHDLVQITDLLVPELRKRGVYRTGYPDAPATLRDLLGMPRALNRYNAAATAARYKPVS